MWDQSRNGTYHWISTLSFKRYSDEIIAFSIQSMYNNSRILFILSGICDTKQSEITCLMKDSYQIKNSGKMYVSVCTFSLIVRSKGELKPTYGRCLARNIVCEVEKYVFKLTESHSVAKMIKMKLLWSTFAREHVPMLPICVQNVLWQQTTRQEGI